MDSRYKALYDFFQTMNATAVDIYWGNDPYFGEEDLREFRNEDYEQAFNNACAEMACDCINETWFNELFAKLAEYYGRHLKVAYIQKGLKETGPYSGVE